MMQKQKSFLKSIRRWAVYLNHDHANDTAVLPKLKSFQMLVLDSDSHPPLKPLKDEGILLIAYVSVGEAEEYRHYWDSVKGSDWIIGENPNWKENHLVDIRDHQWQDLIIDKEIPRVLAKGFNGLFLDTLDTSDTLENMEGEPYEGANDAMVNLVKKIRSSFPDIYIFPNNGLHIMNRIADSLSGVIVEDINTMYDFENRRYIRVPDEERAYKVNVLHDVWKEQGLSVFNIEYPGGKDMKLRKYALSESHNLGFVPYLAEVALDRVYKQIEE